VDTDRIKRVREIIAAEQLDGLLLTSLPNLRYMSGFSGTDGVFFLSSEETVFLTDSRYLTQARDQVRADRVVCYRTKNEAIGELLAEFGTARIGFEAEQVSVSQYEALCRLSGNITWVALQQQLRTLRCRKSAAELALLKQAATLNRQAFAAVLPDIGAGVAERDIALELEIALKRQGGEVNAFDFIVASGVRGAMPHGVASDKLIQNGELVTIDFGTRVAGYHSDETVTLAVGEVDGKLRQIYEIVLEAHDSAIAAVRPGLAIAELDAVARDFIAARGYADYFGHGLGHGVGLEVHEYPALNSRSEDRLEEGMVITIEPGIYLPDVGGVRIEDTVVVTTSGSELLTSLPKNFCQL
jgi:Xaa-Pro aminopeptidase